MWGHEGTENQNYLCEARFSIAFLLQSLIILKIQVNSL